MQKYLLTIIDSLLSQIFLNAQSGVVMECMIFDTYSVLIET